MEEFVQSSGDDGIVIFSLGSLVDKMPKETSNMIAFTLAQIQQKVSDHCYIFSIRISWKISTASWCDCNEWKLQFIEVCLVKISTLNPVVILDNVLVITHWPVESVIESVFCFICRSYGDMMERSQILLVKTPESISGSLRMTYWVCVIICDCILHYTKNIKLNF